MDKITRERGFQCSSYKDKCLRRRIAVRLRARNIASCADYARVLDGDEREYARLMRSLTVNVTKFFRNWETYAAIDQKVIPDLMERSDREIRIWSAGCSSGEEAYSLAILMHRYAAAKRETARLEDVSIVGTDVDADCVAEAATAVYKDSALRDTPADLRRDYFSRVDGRNSVAPEARRLVRFQPSDLLHFKAPVSTAQLIVCRNVIIYFERAAQDALIAHFHQTLAAGGFLVLGKVETLLGESRGLFSAVNARERIFRKL
jgi:chemotaxis protein methyltransferase CheR